VQKRTKDFLAIGDGWRFAKESRYNYCRRLDIQELPEHLVLNDNWLMKEGIEVVLKSLPSLCHKFFLQVSKDLLGWQLW